MGVGGGGENEAHGRTHFPHTQSGASGGSLGWLRESDLLGFSVIILGYEMTSSLFTERELSSWWVAGSASEKHPIFRETNQPYRPPSRCGEEGSKDGEEEIG